MYYSHLKKSFSFYIENFNHVGLLEIIKELVNLGILDWEMIREIIPTKEEDFTKILENRIKQTYSKALVHIWGATSMKYTVFLWSEEFIGECEREILESLHNLLKEVKNFDCDKKIRFILCYTPEEFNSFKKII